MWIGFGCFYFGHWVQPIGRWPFCIATKLQNSNDLLVTVFVYNVRKTTSTPRAQHYVVHVTIDLVIIRVTKVETKYAWADGRAKLVKKVWYFDKIHHLRRSSFLTQFVGILLTIFSNLSSWMPQGAWIVRKCARWMHVCIFYILSHSFKLHRSNAKPKKIKSFRCQFDTIFFLNSSLLWSICGAAIQS